MLLTNNTKIPRQTFQTISINLIKEENENKSMRCNKVTYPGMSQMTDYCVKEFTNAYHIVANL